MASNAADLTMTIEAEYPCSVERLWEAYSDPRQLERFWGPEQWPATFTRHDMRVGGESHYYMTGPDGQRSSGWFRFLTVEPGKRFEVEDGFSNPDGSRNDAMPSMRMVFTFTATKQGSRFKSVTYFPSLEAMEELVKMGMVEGTKSAMSQIDAVLADLKTFAASRPTEAQILNDTQIRVSRVIRGSVQDVWRAHHEPALMQRWLLGPDGWTMPVCEIATKVGQRYRFEWEAEDKSQRFGFVGELLESAPPYRAVTTEQMIGMDGEPSKNEMTLTAVPAGTLLSIVITYPNKEVRDIVLGTGMTVGMETSYARLEREILVAA
ncbi:MAG: SRPBCC domain-containing protein [Gemmatimonadaceae bacterium]|nr:SRPBCC domain-containing protein [Gemmatimonadaceae bacterium]MCW5827231.1 SRPBCC domain-containing protein [Gemmatimonadaceae bacterium]